MFSIASSYVFIGVAMAFFLVPDPKEVGIEMAKEEAAWDESNRVTESQIGERHSSLEEEVQLTQREPLLAINERDTASETENQNYSEGQRAQVQVEEERIRWLDALCAPKVLLYGFTFFCIKFSIYAILLWMPMCMSEVHGYSNQEIANILTGYEIATLLGTCSLGPLTDLTYGKRSPVAVIAIAFASLTAFFLTFLFDDLSRTGLVLVMFALGFFLGSIYHIVNITCCADLGKEQRGKQATSTISGIIDGCGSLGTGTGMFCLGFFIDRWGY